MFGETAEHADTEHKADIQSVIIVYITVTLIKDTGVV